MAINKNHEFEELDGVKCGIVEKNVTPERAEFLKSLLEFNRYTVMVVPSPAPKAAPAKPVAEGEVATPVPTPEPPKTFTVGVTDYTFNSINAIFGRSLKTKDGHVVTLAYWNQQENISNDEVPYFDKK
ncbi:MAG: hypothetical protein JST81_09325 [Bacteroidetes bacterium]|mgnify:CR=1 FL=1|jgi:hypothetical protein|nr:hypothetical protein [Bacteroidota bacterium]